METTFFRVYKPLSSNEKICYSPKNMKDIATVLI